MDYEKMTDEQLDALIAMRLFGWHRIEVGQGYHATVRAHVTSMNDPDWLDCPPKYSSDMNRAAEMEAKVKALGAQAEYGRVLGEIILGSDFWMRDVLGLEVFALATATARQRAIAALRCMEPR